MNIQTQPGDAQWIRHGARNDSARSVTKAWLVATALLWLYGLAWWLELRPGVFTDDSGLYLKQVMSGELANQKPYLYTRFLQVITLGGHIVHYAALIQALLALWIVARMFALAWVHRAPRWLLGVGVLLVANPFFMAMAFYVQNDPLFSIALVAVIVETLHCRMAGRVTRTSMAMVGLMLPMALLFRQNGLLFVPLWALALPWLLGRREALRIAAPGALTCVVALATMMGVDTRDTLDVRYPAVVHAISGLAREEYGHAAGVNLSEETRVLVGPRRLQVAAQFHNPRYWDFGGFYPRGPQFHMLDELRKDAIVSSFVRNDLWPNLPSVIAARTDMLVSILMGRGTAVKARQLPHAMPSVLAEIIKANAPRAGSLTRAMDYYYGHPWTRASLWSLMLLVCVGAVGVWRHCGVTLWACALLLLQMAIIATVAPSADARYVLYIYLSPFVVMLLPSARRAKSRPGSVDSQSITGYP